MMYNKKKRKRKIKYYIIAAIEQISQKFLIEPLTTIIQI